MDKNKYPESPETEMLKKVGDFSVKAILLIGVCATFAYVFSSCGISKEDMQECKSVCGDKGILSVSQWSCQCGWTSKRTDYVIPSYTLPQKKKTLLNKDAKKSK